MSSVDADVEAPIEPDEPVATPDQGDETTSEGQDEPAIIDDAPEPVAEADGQQEFIDGLKRDGRVYRMSRVDLRVEPETLALINRALAHGDALRERGDAVTMQAMADGLRTDGVEERLTQEGFLMMPVWAARSGSQRYGDTNGDWYEYRSPAEVEASCESYGLRPFTDDHPDEFVTPANYTQYNKGACGQDAVLAEPATDGERYVRVTVLVGDYATLAKIKRGLEADMSGKSGRDVGKLELSAGYTCIAVEDPGVDPISGVRYRYRQTQIIINHLALVDRGRAGPLARFSMEIDGAAWELKDSRKEPATTEDADVKPNKDMLDPELGAMLLQAVASYYKPESPEAKAAAHEALAEMTGVPPEQVTAILMPEGGEMEEPDDAGEPGMEREEVDIDGIKVLMDSEAKTAWNARLEQAQNGADSVTKAFAEMKGSVDALNAKIAGFEAKEEADALLVIRAQISDICPTLGKIWSDKVAKGTFTLDGTQMMEAAVLAISPTLKSAIDEERKKPLTFDAYLRGQYSAIAGKRAPAVVDTADENPTASNVVDMTKMKADIAANAYGKAN